MPWIDIIWTDTARTKIAQHGVSEGEVEDVLTQDIQPETSRRSGRPLVRGETEAGRPLVVVYEQVDAITVQVITAFEP